MLVDDLAWPELSSIGRGATRGNQGQKGVIGPPDSEGRSVLQLRVQPGVLAVLLNRRTSDWYRVLDGEVNRALKLTKTYWRKARRRQDYDARADQDHMELHEWLQQLKDKAMSHLELLMQKGDIQGPPYTMPEDLELPFLRKFIDRHRQGIPHNPRLRNISQDNQALLPDETIESVSSETPEVSGASDLADRTPYLLRRAAPDGTKSSFDSPGPSQRLETPRDSYSAQNRDSLVQSAHSSMQKLQDARSALSVAQKESQDAFRRYTTCLDAERHARQQVTAAEKNRDDIMFVLLSHNQTSTVSSRQSSPSLDDNQSSSRNQTERVIHAPHQSGSQRHPSEAARHNGENGNVSSWQDTEGSAIYPVQAGAEFQLADHGQTQPQPFEEQALVGRKHSRDWDTSEQLQAGQSNCEDVPTFSPRKRMHQVTETYDNLRNVAVTSANISLPS